MNAMITTAVSKNTSPPINSRTTEKTKAVSVPRVISVSMFAERRRARATPEARIGQPAMNCTGAVNASADHRAHWSAPKP